MGHWEKACAWSKGSLRGITSRGRGRDGVLKEEDPFLREDLFSGEAGPSSPEDTSLGNTVNVARTQAGGVLLGVLEGSSGGPSQGRQTRFPGRGGEPHPRPQRGNWRRVPEAVGCRWRLCVCGRDRAVGGGS